MIHYISTKTETEVKAAIDDELAKALTRYYMIRKAEKKLADNRIFPFTQQRLGQILAELRERANIRRKIRPHDFCDTTMTRMGEKNIDPALVAQQVGRDPLTVQRKYQKYDLQTKEDAVRKALSLSAIANDLEED